MKFTNKADLPEGIVNAIINDTYDKGKADYSVSQLNMPPQMLWLIKKHWDEITVDVSDEIWKLLGSNVHYILEKSQDASIEKIAELRKYKLEKIQQLIKENQPNVDLLSQIKTVLNQTEPKPNPFLMTEERFYGTLGGIVISGKPDWYDLLSKRIEDYKITSVWKIIRKDYEDYEAQLNIYKWLLDENGFDVTQLQINAILKDWKKYEMQRDENYPAIPVVKLNIPVWDKLFSVRYILERLERHEQVKHLKDAEEVAKHFPCTSKERWHGEDKYAIMKPGNSRASKIFDKREEAELFLKSQSGDYVIEERPGVDKRCEEYCLVRDFCAQYQERHRRTVNISDKPVDLGEDINKDISIPTEKPDIKITTHKDEDGTTVIDQVEDNPAKTFIEDWEEQKKIVAEHIEKQREKRDDEEDADLLDNLLTDSSDAKIDEDDSDEDISDILGGLGL